MLSAILNPGLGQVRRKGKHRKMTMYVISAAERVRAAVRAQDPARYHCALFAPAPARAGLFAMIAFHHELANALSRASEPMLARIRLTWWREALDEIAEGRPRRHDVVEALAASLNGPLIDAPLRAMIDAREAEIEAPPPADLAAYRAGVAATAETLAAAMLDHLRVTDPVARAAACRAATAFGMVGRLGAFAHHAARGENILPTNLLAAEGLAVADGCKGPGLSAVGRAVLDAAEAELTAAGGYGRAGRPVGLLAVLAARHIKRLRAVAGDPLDPRAHAPDPWAIWALSWRAWRVR